MPYLRLEDYKRLYQQVKMDKQIQDKSHVLTQNQESMNRIISLLQKHGKFNEEQIAQFREAINDVKLNRVLGCIFGGMIGDALGSYCQFKKTIAKQVLDKAMQMPGGGTFNDILPGQYTDDNELAYHLLKGLNYFNENQSFQSNTFGVIKKIGLQYVRWVRNAPFDIGNTCGAAIYILRKNQEFLQAEIEEEGSSERMNKIFEQIYSENKTRQSNGSLMRITPMAAFYSLFDLDIGNHYAFIKDEISLTHPNNQLVRAGVSWVTILSQLINRKNNDPSTFRQIVQRVRESKQFAKLNDWFIEAQQPREKSMTAAHNMGWAKIAWSYGLKFLISQTKRLQQVNGSNLYKQWIRWVIGRAGDTDTNAAISGGLIGAVIGFRQLPAEYLEKVFSLEYIDVNRCTYRAREYEPTNFLRETLKLIKKSKHYNSWNKNKPQET